MTLRDLIEMDVDILDFELHASFFYNSSYSSGFYFYKITNADIGYSDKAITLSGEKI
jgi:hypothetical protein